MSTSRVAKAAARNGHGTTPLLQAIVELPRGARPGTTQVWFEPAATDAILDFTQCFPYFLQEFGKHAWNLAPDPAITMAVVERARPQVSFQLDENFFRVRIGRNLHDVEVSVRGPRDG